MRVERWNARPLGIEYEGARYHVLSQGDRREDIFIDDGDRKRFAETLNEAATRAGWHVHAYCLIGRTPMTLRCIAATLHMGSWPYVSTCSTCRE